MTLPGNKIVETVEIQAQEIGVGDVLANLGAVHAVTVIGMFCVVQYRIEVWSLATGTPSVINQDAVFHMVDMVLVVKP